MLVLVAIIVIDEQKKEILQISKKITISFHPNLSVSRFTCGKPDEKALL